MENLKCQMCPSFYTLTIAVMLSHLISVHGSEPNFSVTCEVPGCQRTFRKPRSYQSHLRRLHSDFNLHSSVRVWNEIDSDKKMRGEEEEITMDIMEDEIVNEESLYDKIVDRLDEKRKHGCIVFASNKVALTNGLNKF